MFGSKLSPPQKPMHYQLGKGSRTLIAASKHQSEIELVMLGTADITSTVKLAKQYFGLTVENGSKFAEFASALDRNDVSTMAEMIRCFGEQLDDLGTYEDQGHLVESWFRA